MTLPIKSTALTPRIFYRSLAAIIVAHFSINLPILRRDQEVLSEPRETMQVAKDYGRTINVPGMEISLTIPFEGEGRYFNYQPDAFTSPAPIGQVTSGNKLILIVKGRELVAQQVRDAFENNLAEIEKYLGWQRKSVEPFNARLRQNALEAIAARKKKLLHARNMAASIGLNMKPVLPYPSSHKAPQIQRKPAPPSLSSAKRQAFVSEPELVEGDYQHILGIIEAMAKVMERSPESFVHLDEENMRQHFLIPLNGHYEGIGTAEAFNSEGKTDILIRIEDRNVFIAECKFWGGQKAAQEAIDQLLGYLTWRDTKSCLIMFSRLKDYSYVLGELWKSVEIHPNFKREERKEGETRRRYVFRSKNDPDRELILTVLAFNIPKI
ncbi:hypothetical protein ACVIHI_008324 [Bradyrhizobium sp. USDA 4524]|uniref:hypothetical protein n=1 Tax=unclassified Bradyrhizobium TaxID=2631580 RepID=UPI00209F92A6|nr:MULTISPECIES: hypothetical protein [unclassified Bradyrhizobium]MCP1838750.1 hypothetical protein [Bradyrhizobium sp. USDA 4538]MCP1899316.1 hypothetical protein [Bradyrhizobium sp. USDA 4537]MCP1986572.1 hypothetical protein [Bradyrhizobium sp. USDA 4539]